MQNDFRANLTFFGPENEDMEPEDSLQLIGSEDFYKSMPNVFKINSQTNEMFSTPSKPQERLQSPQFSFPLQSQDQGAFSNFLITSEATNEMVSCSEQQNSKEDPEGSQASLNDPTDSEKGFSESLLLSFGDSEQEFFPEPPISEIRMAKEENVQEDEEEVVQEPSPQTARFSFLMNLSLLFGVDYDSLDKFYSALEERLNRAEFVKLIQAEQIKRGFVAVLASEVEKRHRKEEEEGKNSQGSLF